MDAHVGARRDEPLNRAAAADLDVVAMGAEEERRVDFRSAAAKI
jgi:hypothetical protein